jgi:hypothetical protein
MRKIVGTSLVLYLRGAFAEFGTGDLRRVFLWDEGHGYPDAEGRVVSLDQLERPFCLVQVADSEAQSMSLAAAGGPTQDQYDVLVHVYCRPPEESAYEFETLPEAIKQHLVMTDVDFLDLDEDPPVLIDRATPERVMRSASASRGLADPLTLYRSTIRLRYVFYRTAR